MTESDGTPAPAPTPTDSTAAPGTEAPAAHSESILQRAVAAVGQLNEEVKSHFDRISTLEQSVASQQTAHHSLAADFEELKAGVETRLHNLEVSLKELDESLVNHPEAATAAAHQAVADTVAEHTKNLSWARREIEAVKDELAKLRKLATGA